MYFGIHFIRQWVAFGNKTVRGYVSVMEWIQFNYWLVMNTNDSCNVSVNSTTYAFESTHRLVKNVPLFKSIFYQIQRIPILKRIISSLELDSLITTVLWNELSAKYFIRRSLVFQNHHFGMQINDCLTFT